jgi:hypothetical protein
MVENRYTTYIKFHSTQKFMAEYIGGFLGLYSMDFTADTAAGHRQYQQRGYECIAPGVFLPSGPGGILPLVLSPAKWGIK